jgi:hypothetical protein
MLTGNGALSLRKKDLENQRVPAVGFKKTVFAHKASAGQTGINLNSLTTPVELASNGFLQPNAAELANAQLLFYRNNLKLISSARGVLIDFISYSVASSTQISFLGFTALEGEIFYGVIDYSALTGLKVVDASPIIATGTLEAGQTDFSVGTPFTVNKHASANLGAVLVYVDRVLQQRNTGNSSTVKDKDYYEVDAGSGLGSIIRFNGADPDASREIMVVSNGLLSERPDGSMMAVIESLSGYVDNITAVVSQLSGLTTSSVKGAAPSNVDLKSFGDKVFNLESNRARIDLSNSWSVYQSLIGRADGSSAGAGIIGQGVRSVVNQGSSIAVTTNVVHNITSITLTPGEYDISFGVNALQSSGGTLTTTSVEMAISTVSATFPSTTLLGDAWFVTPTGPNANANTTLTAPIYTVNITATTTYYLVFKGVFSGSTMHVNGKISARRV